MSNKSKRRQYLLCQKLQFEYLHLISNYSSDILLNNKYFQFAQMVKVGSAEQIISLVANSDMVALMPASLISMHPYTQANCIKGFPIKALENERITHWLLHKPINRLTSVERIVFPQLKYYYQSCGLALGRTSLLDRRQQTECIFNA